MDVDEKSETKRAEQRGYSKGYAAGQRRLARERVGEAVSAKRSDFERQVFLAILPQLVDKPWQKDGKSWSNMDDFISGAHKFARLSANRYSFELTIQERALLSEDPQ